MAQRLAEQVWIEDQAAMNAQYGGVKSGAETEGAGDAVQAPEEDEIREAMYYRLERLGYRVGLGLVESYVLSHPVTQSSATNAHHRLLTLPLSLSPSILSSLHCANQPQPYQKANT